ncbi:MAG: hypothetical protein AB1454_07275 [Candidatus Auribacterota bacterium]|jgi:hypothetical protein|uniref:Uncharacterized protein n=1 Tax=Candidatus Auribacter fodinae TaxID=2093366 RepID=A0A3A4R7F4_9BACT|nr:MAG: hypothetical protein C4541_10130 [Candidatus Auribacter fodinae]
MKERIQQIKNRLLQLLFGKKSSTVVSSDAAAKSSMDKERLAHIYKIQEENNRKLQEMNLRIAQTIRRIDDVKRRMLNAKVNESELNLSSRPYSGDRPLRKKSINLRNFNEFVDLREFLKFNRMDIISEEEISQCNWDQVFKQLCKE